MLPLRLSSCGEVKINCPILQNPHRIHLILLKLKFGIWEIIIGLVIDRVSVLQDEGLEVFVLHVYKCVFIKASVMFIE